MSQNIFLPNFNLSLLQSQKHFTNNKIKTNKINISTEIVPSINQDCLEIKLIVDSPFGQLQISNNIFIKVKEQSSTQKQDFCSLESNQNTLLTNQAEKNDTINQFLGIYDNQNSQCFIQKKQISSQSIEEIYEEEEDKQKSTAPNSPNQQKYTASTSNSPASSQARFEDFQVDNANIEYTETEESQKLEEIRTKSQTILTSSSMSTTSLIIEDESEEFNTSQNDDAQSTFIKSEKKNSVKNVLKAFGNFILNMNENQNDEIVEQSSFKSVEDLKKRYLRYNKNQSYNNSLVCKIIQHQQYGIVFKHFINNYASSWLERSDVGDKASHETFINFCKSACEDHELLNCLKIIKKKHLKLSSC
ncbi:hypothetical protein ABPG74_000173 [Tetrahymena malaccensis]